MRDKIRYDHTAREYLAALTQDQRDEVEASIAKLHAIALREVGAYNAAAREGKHRWPERSFLYTEVSGASHALTFDVTWCVAKHNYTRTTAVTSRLRFVDGKLESSGA